MCLQHCILANAILIFTGGSSVLCVKIPQIPPAFVHLRPSPLALLDYVALSVELSVKCALKQDSGSVTSAAASNRGGVGAMGRSTRAPGACAAVRPLPALKENVKRLCFCIG
ncbi:PREDICTED: uncharacterized protein LOC109216284 isoform X2 [Nicotiana attenuata]|uniref:Secreted protein n=1 Tax=Nicotiana attenuata TaxID=49451 RepID=A0A1J6KNP3_NICAT|nr:PREDICTED: uncharacterized protein LOC109216284 isoform X2 [Nicotiana attenuata]OIT24435.1 hypothetical protein A4A49_29805 [Nicotiana attenuata]